MQENCTLRGLWWSCICPDHTDIVGRHEPIGGDEQDVLDLGLRDQDPIQWILVMRGRSGDPEGVPLLDGQRKVTSRGSQTRLPWKLVKA
jgi:hypothetical protein